MFWLRNKKTIFFNYQLLTRGLLDILHRMTYIRVFQLMGCGVAGLTGQYAVQHVGLVYSSERGGVSFQLELHVDKTALVTQMNKETAVIALAQVRYVKINKKEK